MCHRGSADDVECRDVELGPNAACKTINHEIENAAEDGDLYGGNRAYREYREPRDTRAI